MIKTKTCNICGVEFSCGTTEADGSCWCTALPNIVPMPDSGDCLCPQCLNNHIDKLRTSKANMEHNNPARK